MENVKNAVNTAKVIMQITELLQALSCESGLMENAGKIHGFRLIPKPPLLDNQFFKSVIYKDPKTKQWLIRAPIEPKTKDEGIANAFAIANKERIIQKYHERKANKKVKTDGREFYQMLLDYYTKDSIYLKDDEVNNRQPLPYSERELYKNRLINHIIPFLKDKKINTIQDLTDNIYSELKIFLTTKFKSKKSITNVLLPLNRIIAYHIRKGLLAKAPYPKGGGYLKQTRREKKEKQPEFFPTIIGVEKGYKSLFEVIIPLFIWDYKKRPDYYYLLAMFALTTGARPGEIGKIKYEDIIHLKKSGAFLVKIANEKNERYQTTEYEEYRMVPLHPFLMETLCNYMKKLNKEGKKVKTTDYIFGTTTKDKDTGKPYGMIHSIVRENTALLVYKCIMIYEEYYKAERAEEGEKISFPSLALTEREWKNEMQKKKLQFYSFRHSFQTICDTYQGKNAYLSNNTIDYFMGHLSSTMRDTYSHMNSVYETGPDFFYKDYASLVIEVMDKYVFINDNERKEYKKSIEKGKDILLKQQPEVYKDKDKIPDWIVNKEIILPRQKEEEEEAKKQKPIFFELVDKGS